MNHEQKARELMAAIRREVFRPEVTTMGRCPRCGESSRGAGVCADCLGIDLSDLIGSSMGMDYTDACIAQREAEMRVLAALGGGTSKQRAALDELVREAQERGEYGGRE